jgi:hypothetical protein
MRSDPTRIEIITGREWRRRCSAEQKLASAEETMQGRGRHARVGRSNLVEQLAGNAKPRGRDRRQKDDELSAAIRQLTDARPTHGYRRITALLKRARGRPTRNLSTTSGCSV